MREKYIRLGNKFDCVEGVRSTSSAEKNFADEITWIT